VYGNVKKNGYREFYHSGTLNDGEQTTRNLLFFLYVKQTCLICQYLTLKESRNPYEEIM